MPDSFVVAGLFNNLATKIELASYAIAAEGIDFDNDAVRNLTYAENPAVDGGQRAYERSRVRNFKFPLRLASGWPGAGGLNGFENFVREITSHPYMEFLSGTQTGYVEILPENASHTIRFQLLGGRVVPRPYSVYMQRLARRDVDLLLDVQPLGYMPTMILLASVAMSSGMVTLTWNPTQILGDMPGRAKIGLAASITASTSSFVNPALILDGMYWTLSQPSGATALFVPSQMSAGTNTSDPYAGSGSKIWGASHIVDAFAPAGVALRHAVVGTFSASTNNYGGGFRVLSTIALDNSQPYKGLYRLLAYMRTTPSHAIPWQVTMDVSAHQTAPLASGNVVATLTSQGASTTSFTSIPSAYQLLDFGLFEFPPVIASGLLLSTVQTPVRLWLGAPTSNMGLATSSVDLGGIVLLPVGGDSGIMAAGLGYPTAAGPGIITSDALHVDTIRRRVGIARISVNQVTDWLTDGLDSFDGRIYHTGAYPAISTSQSLVGICFGRAGPIPANPTANLPWGRTTMHPTYSMGAAISYQPTFAFLRGI